MKVNSSSHILNIYLFLLIGGLIAFTSCSDSSTGTKDKVKPDITSVKPLTAPVNATVTINGTNLGSTTADNNVSFGAITATVNSASKTKLTVTVPAELTVGSKYVVRDSVNGKAAIAPERFIVTSEPVTAGAVSQDGTLEAVTWNLLKFQGETGVKLNNDVKITDSLNADLYAFQEVLGKDAIQALASRMEGYNVVYDKTTNQGNAFVYNTNAIDSVSSGKITMGQMSNPWAGRLPYYFSFNYKPGNGANPIKIYAVVIHAKAGAGQEDYNRRKKGAQELYNYLTNQKPNARIILLGDYNDKPDTSIYEGHESPYKPFVDDKANYSVLTYDLSKNGETSETGYTSVIDNITISNEMVKYYDEGSVHVFIPTDDFINNYGSTTSDHYPVEAKFDMTR